MLKKNNSFQLIQVQKPVIVDDSETPDESAPEPHESASGRDEEPESPEV